MSKKKKLILSLATASALWMSGQIPMKTEAATTTPAVQERVYVYHTQNVNLNDINRFIEEALQRFGLQGYFNFQAPAQSVKAPAKDAAPAKPAPAKAAAPAPVKTPVQAPAKTTAPAPAQTAGTLSAYEQQVVSLTNQERAKSGLAALKVDATLSKMAREKSRDMSANGYFDHTSPTYGSPFDMMKQYGISYTSAGENIAMGQKTPQEVVTAWMNSEGHRKNIMNPRFTHIGVGYIGNGSYWTQEFIGK